VDIDALRAETPGCGHRMHLNNAGAALLARPTLDVMTRHLRLEAEIGGYEAAAAAWDAVEATYDNIAELVRGRSDEIALFDNATHAWNAAFYSIPFGPGDRIVTGRAEYGSNVLAYFQMAQRTGADVVVVPNDEHGQLDTAALADLVDERTKLIGVSHVPTSGGLVNPAAEIGRIAQEADVLYLLDATQSVGQFPVDVEAIGCDLLTGTGRKFLRGPRGTGFLWVRSSALDRLDPYVAEIRSATWDGGRGFTWVDGAQRFETWENSYLNVLGLGAAVRQALDLGLEAIGERAIAMGARLRRQLDELPGVSTHDLGAVRCAIVTARVEGVPSADVVTALGQAGVNVSVTVPGDTQFDTEDRGVHPLVRLSPHYYNTEDELDRAVALFAALVP
jgi:selenocysteine lyase/cysteine desulfurase